MVAGYLSPLLMDWTLAVTELNTSIAHKLLEKEPELLWTPIPHALDDTDHLLNELVELTKLGSSFQPVSAIQFTLLQYRENSQDSIQSDRFKFLSYLIEQSTLHDLDTRFWGECNNSTLHLVCFLDQTKLVQLLISKGVSTTPTNGLGYLPKDITTSEHIIDLLSKAPPQQQKNGSLRSKPTVVRPNYSTPDRFKLLRDLAEESSVIGDESNKLLPEILERKKSEVHYFRKGRVKETQQKVLITDEEKQKSSKRQLEVAQLAKKSAVKNNPLWKKMEKVTFVTSPIPSPSTSSTHLPRQVSLEQVVVEITETCTTPAVTEPLIQPKPKRNSKVISSLQKKSYVSSSIFVQADEESTVDNKNLIPPVPTTTTPSSPIIDPGVTTKQNLDNETQTIAIYSTEPNELQEHDIQKSSSDQSSEDEDDCYFESNSNNQSESLIHAAKQPEPTYNHSRNNHKKEEKKLIVAPIDHTFSFSSSSNEDIANTFLSFTSNSSSEEEELSVTVNHTPVSFSHHDNNNQKEKTPLPLNRVCSFSSNEEQESNDEAAEEIVAVSRKFIPQQPKNITVDTYNRHTMTSDEEEEEYSDDEYGEATPVQFATRLISPVYKSVVIMNEEKFELPTKLTYADNSALEMKIPDTQLPVEPSSPTPVRPQRSDLRKPTSPVTAAVETPINESKEKKRMSGSQKAAWTMSMSSWAAILDREFNLDELDQQKKVKERQQSLQSEKIHEEEDTAVIPATTTFNYLDSKLQISDDEEEEMKLSFPPITSNNNKSKSRISFQSVVHQQQSPPLSPTLSQKPLLKLSKPPQIAEIPRLNYSKSISRKPIEASLSETTITKKNIRTTSTVPSSRTIQVQQTRLQHGKLYLHVNGIQDILLPLPKDRAYVRCVVSDGRFEYMSRYEILSQNINFDYECVIDTHPDMIITISLHVRPDYVMKSKTPFSRLFSSKKKKESLSGYVNKEDGAIGQARFALAHMLPVCVETTYPAEFHCFNAWYSRSFKERHRQKKKDPDQDVLKVVGNFDVEMLYLPISNYQKPFPRNLRECDAVIQGLYKSVEDSSEKYHTF